MIGTPIRSGIRSSACRRGELAGRSVGQSWPSLGCVIWRSRNKPKMEDEKDLSPPGSYRRHDLGNRSSSAKASGSISGRSSAISPVPTRYPGVQPDRSRGSLERRHALDQEAEHDAGQDIAGACRGKAAGPPAESFARRGRDHGVATLEQHRRTTLRRGGQRPRQPVAFMGEQPLESPSCGVSTQGRGSPRTAPGAGPGSWSGHPHRGHRPWAPRARAIRGGATPLRRRRLAPSSMALRLGSARICANS